MFYTDGDLGAGLNKAVREGKLVACFVADQESESQVWESEYLSDPELQAALAEHTVMLRLADGSNEAAFLAAIVPVPKTPTFVLIHNGNLREYIVAGTAKDEFKRRLLVVLGRPSAVSSEASIIQHPETRQAQQTNDAQHLQEHQQAEQHGSSTPMVNGVQTTEPTQDSAVQALLAERSARLEVHKVEQEAKEKEKRRAEAKARREATETSASVDPSSQRAADVTYATMQRKRREDARAERERILRLVEDDRVARRERSATLRGQAVPKAGNTVVVSESRRAHNEVALQIRLFDGSTVRSRFPARGSILEDLRPFVDQKQGSDIPYTFKQVLMPLPNKDIAVGEEEHSFAQLGLLPSATLILVPVAGYTTAYEDTSYAGMVTRPVSAAVGLLGSGVGAITGLLGSFWAGGQANPQSDGSPVQRSVPPTPRTATLHDQRRDDQQFYNGNALNFEPRQEDGGKED